MIDGAAPRHAAGGDSQDGQQQPQQPQGEKGGGGGGGAASRRAEATARKRRGSSPPHTHTLRRRRRRPPSIPEPPAMRLLVLAALLAAAPPPEVCGALNVTVSPGPKVQYVVGDNATLFCHVSQKRRIENLLAVRWVFALPPTQEYLMIKMTKYGVVQYYGNYTRQFYKQRLHLLKESHRATYTFLILNLQQADQGHYVCRVQEISKHRSKWTSWSNGSASTEIQVISSQGSDDSTAERNHKAWKIFEDLYVYAVFVCSVGIVSILLFTLVIFCQTLINKKQSQEKL